VVLALDRLLAAPPRPLSIEDLDRIDAYLRKDPSRSSELNAVNLRPKLGQARIAALGIGALITRWGDQPLDVFAAFRLPKGGYDVRGPAVEVAQLADFAEAHAREANAIGVEARWIAAICAVRIGEPERLGAAIARARTRIASDGDVWTAAYLLEAMSTADALTDAALVAAGDLAADFVARQIQAGSIAASSQVDGFVRRFAGRLLAVSGVTAYGRFAWRMIGWIMPLSDPEAAPGLAAASDAERAALRAAVEKETKDPYVPSAVAVLTVLSDHSPDYPSLDALPNDPDAWVAERVAAAVVQALLHPEVRRQRGQLTARGRARMERLIGRLTASRHPDLARAGANAARDLAALSHAAP
jgi:hypothetical protein